MKSIELKHNEEKHISIPHDVSAIQIESIVAQTDSNNEMVRTYECNLFVGDTSIHLGVEPNYPKKVFTVMDAIRRIPVQTNTKVPIKLDLITPDKGDAEKKLTLFYELLP